MRCIALVIWALLWAIPALATDRFVSTNGSAAWVDATSSLTPASLATARANANDDDVVYFADGNYVSQGALSPSNSGSSGHRITFIGNPTTPANVILSQISLGPQDYITARGFTAAGISMAATSATNSADYDSVVQCVSTDDVNMDGANYCVFEQNTVGTSGANNYGVTFSMSQVPGGLTFHCPDVGSSCAAHIRPKGNRVAWNTFNLGNNGSTYCWETAYACSISVCFNRINMVYGPAAFNTMFVNNYTNQNSTYRGNVWTAKNQHATDSQRYIFAFRDSSRFLTFDRDSFIVDATSSQSGRMQMCASGSVQTAGSGRYLTLDSCYINLAGNGSLGGDVVSQFKSVGLTMSYCTIVLGGGSMFQFQNDSLVWNHNTVYKIGSGALWDNQSTTDLSNSTVTNSIFCAAQGSGGGVYRWFKYSGTHNFDHNLAFSIASPTDSGNAVANNANTHLRMGPSSSWCTSESNDCNSRWGNPRFSAASSNNFTLTSGTVADFGPDGYVGAVGFGVVNPTDTAPPATVSDLSINTVNTTTLLLGYTAPGDDGYSGQPDTLLIRRASAQIITESDWNNATVVASLSGGSLAQAGAEQQYTVTGLTASTTYWFAVRARDDAGNFGGIDSDVGTTSTSPDVTPPSAVADMFATTAGSTSILLTWTASGDNGITGTARNYRLKRRVGTTFVLADSAAATAVPCNFLPNTPGNLEHVIVGGLSPSTSYAFALWVADATGNISTISNAATAATTATAVLPSPSLANNIRRRRR